MRSLSLFANVICKNRLAYSAKSLGPSTKFSIFERSRFPKIDIRGLASDVQEQRKPRQKRQKAMQNLLKKPLDHQPTGKVVAVALAEEIDLKALQAAMFKADLIEMDKDSDALNLLGEAVYLPQFQDGEVFVFEEGCVAFWNVSSGAQQQFMETILNSPGVQIKPYSEPQSEDMPYVLTDSLRNTQVRKDTIHLASLPDTDTVLSDEIQISKLPAPGKEVSLVRADLPLTSAAGLPMDVTTLLSRLICSAGLIRSCKLAVAEEQLEHHLERMSGIPLAMQSRFGRLPSKHEIIASHGELISIRQELNLTDANLLDPPTDLLWQAGQKQEDLFDHMTLTLDCDERLRNLNQKLDYGLNLQSILLDLQSTRYSHKLEWIIIILIATEIGLVLYREGLPFA